MTGDPKQRVITTDFLSELSYTNSESVGNMITHPMKRID
jgi:hypothetical protein